MKNVMKHSFVFGLALTLLTPAFSWAGVDAAILQQYVGQDTRIPLIKPSWGNFIIHSDRLKKLYLLRNFEPIWVNAEGYPNEMAQALSEILKRASRHGLNPGDYWDADVENLFQTAQKNPNIGLTFEMAASEALIRYSAHLSGGRVDPSSIDDDIKFQKKTFAEYSQLNAALSYGTSTFMSDMDGFAPQHPIYRHLQGALINMRSNLENWEVIKSPGFELKYGVNSPVVSKLRQRLNALGYKVSYDSGDMFDSDLQSAVIRYQEANNLVADGKISVKSQFLDSINMDPKKRISQIQITMEKLRWLPRDLGGRHIFVNLASTNFKMFDGNQKVFDFKTINGQQFRRTPSMADAITFVNLNPYWVVPRSIAIRDKLPSLKANPNYLKNNQMLLIDERTDKEVDPYTINWAAMTPAKFTYYIKQLPGRHNALGVVKFPLQNPWAIYLHDTNEKGLFKERERHRSSGCVRLERPLELAESLLNDKQNWSVNHLRAYTPNETRPYVSPDLLDRKLILKQRMPVYLMYLTVDLNDNGEVRFLADPYGQDARVALAIQNKKISGEVF